MNRYFNLILIFLIGFSAMAQGFGGNQILDPVKWEGRVEKVSDTEYNVIFQAQIDQDWHMYSQYNPDGGSLPLTLEFVEPEGKYDLNGDAKESETRVEFNDIFGVDEKFWEEDATLTQHLTITDSSTTVVKTIVDYQVCKDVCIAQTYYFGFDLKNQTAKVFTDYDSFQAFGAKKQEGKTQESKKAKKKIKDEAPASRAANKEQEQKGLLTIFILAFFSGFLALLTPCVFPMIPMTVGYFTKQAHSAAVGKRNALLYGLFIVVIYVVLGTVVTAIFGADVLNALATNVWFNVVFFLLLVVFAISFFGAFEIMLPHSWANAVDKQADRGGLVGIFFMALALAIVSFSCTGPIVGTLLVQAASSGGVAPIVGMLGFSLAIAIPFALFALFPSWMNSLPKSGGWLNSVKVVLGFLELALALKFLSNADLVLQAHFLEREVFLAIWIAIFGGLAFYLFGKIKLAHDTPKGHISSGRLVFGLFVLAFTIYMIPGLWGAPLKLISGFPPPMNYSEAPFGVGYTKVSGNSLVAEGEMPDHAELGPHQIMAFTDYDAGLAFAKAKNKPILLDFTGHACVNCRKMEERVWGEPQVLGILKNDVVLISLYVDEKKELPEAEQYTSKTTGKRIRDVGDKWSDFQIKNYGANAQPFYVLLNDDGEALNQPVGYTPNVDDFESWLQDGISAF